MRMQHGGGSVRRNTKAIPEKRKLQTVILKMKKEQASMLWDEATKQVYIETAQCLKGSERRLFMARVVKALGAGGQRQAERELGGCRRTVRGGLHELGSGCVCRCVCSTGAEACGGTLRPFQRKESSKLLY